MKEKIILIFKGFIVGMGKIFPGVSGAVLAITLGIYDRCINAIGNFTKNIKDNINLLFFVGLGVVISIGIFSNIVIFLLNNYYYVTILFFIGLMLGGIPKMYKDSKINVKNYKNILLILISFLLIIIMNNLNASNIVKDSANFVTLILIGIVEAFAMVVPGISGTAILMILGYYDLVILRFSQLFNIMSLYETIVFFIPFGLGMIIGSIIFSKVINYCLEKSKTNTYCIIFGLVLSSVFILFNSINMHISIFDKILGILFLIVGYLVANLIEKINN